MVCRAAARIALSLLLIGGLLATAQGRTDDAPAIGATADSSADAQPTEKRATPQPPALPQQPVAPRPLATSRGPVTPPTTQPNPTEIAQANPATDLSSSPVRRYYSLASTPNMLGDVLGMRYFFGGAGNLSLAGGDRGAKIADDSRPLPTDRVFFDYNHFDRANVTANGALVGLDRYTIGVEKTFCDGLWSIEFKAPIDSGLARTQDPLATTADNEGTVFGDLAIAPKVLLYENGTTALAAGLFLDLPTAPDAQFVSQGATRTLVKDDAVHVEPFLGLQFAPNCRLFSITYLQFDFDVGGDRVFVVPITAGQPIELGRIHGPNLVYVDWSAGYWLFHQCPCDCCCRRGFLTGVTPVIELHYATAIENARSVATVEAARERIDILNLTTGVHFELGPCSTLAVAVAVPLRDQPRDKEFSTELLVEFNRRF